MHTSTAKIGKWTVFKMCLLKWQIKLNDCIQNTTTVCNPRENSVWEKIQEFFLEERFFLTKIFLFKKVLFSGNKFCWKKFSWEKFLWKKFIWETFSLEKYFCWEKHFCQGKISVEEKIFIRKNIVFENKFSDKRQKVQESDEINHNLANKVTN